MNAKRFTTDWWVTVFTRDNGKVSVSFFNGTHYYEWAETDLSGMLWDKEFSESGYYDEAPVLPFEFLR